MIYRCGDVDGVLCLEESVVLWIYGDAEVSVEFVGN